MTREEQIEQSRIYHLAIQYHKAFCKHEHVEHGVIKCQCGWTEETLETGEHHWGGAMHQTWLARSKELQRRAYIMDAHAEAMITDAGIVNKVAVQPVSLSNA